MTDEIHEKMYRHWARFLNDFPRDGIFRLIAKMREHILLSGPSGTRQFLNEIIDEVKDDQAATLIAQSLIEMLDDVYPREGEDK